MSSSSTPSRRDRLVLACILLIAFSLRVASLTTHRFHPDEALYATWALTTQPDPALLSVTVDKPPLLMYLLAGIYRALGPSEAVSRLPNVFASVISLAVLGSMARRVYGRRTGLLAAAIYAASPFAIQFAPTVFTDPLLVMWFLLAMFAAAEGRPTWAGVASGLAYATKQQAVLVIPLVVLVCAVNAVRTPEGCGTAVDMRRLAGWRRILRAIFAMIIGFLPICGFVVWWDSLRWHVQSSYWQRSLSSYGGLSLAPAGSWAVRFAQWRPLLSAIFASLPLNGLLLLLLPMTLWLTVRAVSSRQRKVRLSPRTRWDLLFALYTVVYLILHVVVTVQVWDRYLLPLVPILCLLLGRLLDQLICWLGRLLRRRMGTLAFSGASLSRPGLGLAVVAVGLLGLLGGPAWLGAWGQLPVGGDHGAYDGMEVLAEGARSLVPVGGTLYYHDLGWHFGYYLRDARFALVWYADGETLVELVCSSDARLTAIAFAPWEEENRVRQALEEDGLTLVPQFTVHGSVGASPFAFYLIERAGEASCRGLAT